MWWISFPKILFIKLTEYDEKCPLKVDPFSGEYDQEEAQDMEDNHAKQEWLGPVDLEQFMLKLFPEYFSYTYMSQELVNTVDFFGVNCIFW